jgi:hypothetical protein
MKATIQPRQRAGFFIGKLRMKLVDNWQAVLKHAWSLWLIALATALDLGSEVIPYVSDYVAWWVPVVVLVLAFGARLIKQEAVSGASRADAV